MNKKILLLILGSVIVATTAWADRIIVSVLKPPYDLYHPQDRGEIYSSYRALVEKRDGITALEARLITQYEAVMHDLDFNYHIAKPKVIAETAEEWRVRLPSKFSISQNKRPPDFIVCIDKKNGKIMCFQPDDGSH